MIAFFMTLWISIMSLLGFIPEKPLEIETSVPIQQVPTGTPTQSAPQFSLDACVEKDPEENCSFLLNDQELDGICLPSGTALACTPILPE